MNDEQTASLLKRQANLIGKLRLELNESINRADKLQLKIHEVCERLDTIAGNIDDSEPAHASTIARSEIDELIEWIKG